MTARQIAVAQYCSKLHLHYIKRSTPKGNYYLIKTEDFECDLFYGNYRECLAFFYGMLAMQDKYEGKVPLYMSVEV